MSRNSGDLTKKKLILQSFTLFSTKPYDRVTFTDIEKAANLSRGAILYHFASKQEIFNAVIENSLLNRNLFIDLPIKEKKPLESFILDFVAKKSSDIKSMAKIGIKNIYRAYYNIENEAMYYYEQYDKLARQSRSVEIKIWIQVLRKAQENGEIRKNIDIDALAPQFLNAYYGHASAAIVEEKGLAPAVLQKELMFIREAYLA